MTDVWPKLLSNTSGKESKVISKDFLSSVERLGLIAVLNSVKVSCASSVGPSNVVHIMKGLLLLGELGTSSLTGINSARF